MTQLFADEVGAAVLAARILGAPNERTFAADSSRPSECCEYGRSGEFSQTDYWEFCRGFVEAHTAARGQKSYYREVEGRGDFRWQHGRRGLSVRPGRWFGSAPRWAVWVEPGTLGVAWSIGRLYPRGDGSWTVAARPGGEAQYNADWAMAHGTYAAAVTAC